MHYRVAGCLVLFLVSAGPNCPPAGVSAPEPLPSVKAIIPPLRPLPTEEASAGVTRFSFIVYGDTRGRREGKEIQYEHSDL